MSGYSHRSRNNLRFHNEPTWQGRDVYTQRGPLIVNYLEQIDRVIKDATTLDHRRSFVIRFDLRFPIGWENPDSAVISYFFDSLKAQLEACEERKRREGKRVHPCHLRYVWAKEQSSSQNWHYHVAIFLNRDAYFTLGRISSLHDYYDGWDAVFEPASDERNMVDRLDIAWSRALDMSYHSSKGLVHIPKNPLYKLNVKSQDYQRQWDELFYRLSYLAKLDTKRFGDRSKNFGSSRG